MSYARIDHRFCSDLLIYIFSDDDEQIGHASISEAVQISLGDFSTLDGDAIMDEADRAKWERAADFFDIQARLIRSVIKSARAGG